MTSYMVWFDDSGKKLEDKVGEGARHYKRTRGCRPNVCKVHPSALTDGKSIGIDGITIHPSFNVLPHHFFFAYDEQYEERNDGQDRQGQPVQDLETECRAEPE